MQKKFDLAILALCCAQAGYSQIDSISYNNANRGETAFTFTEAMLGMGDDVAQSVPVINSNTNAYASEAGYLFAPVRFRYRAFAPQYNAVYINGVPMNDMETDRFGYSLVDGIRRQTRDFSTALPFEGSTFGMTDMGGSCNYDFRAGHMAPGHRISLAGANRNYTLRGMYSYASGVNDRGWAFAGTVSYRGAGTGYVEGTSYGSLSYFLGVQKFWGNRHSLAFSTWGNPTKRDSQGAATDEAYNLAGTFKYNPYWGYDDGKKRNSRVVKEFSPTALLTWDWNINYYTKLTTSLQARYSWHKGTRLSYSGANPYPDYWENMPSSLYDIWNPDNAVNTAAAKQLWQDACDFWTASNANRQINWDRLYTSNQQAAGQGHDAMYWVQANHNDNLNVALSSALTRQLTDKSSISAGINLAANKGMHYMTMDDLLGVATFHNINTYAIGTYPAASDKVQYDLNNRDGVVEKGDRWGYDYNMLVNKGQVWATYSECFGPLHYNLSARFGYTSMQRDGKMRNGLAADNSYGKSKTADMTDGGIKFGSTLSLGHGHSLSLGVGYEHRAPQASVAFVAPEVNNDIVDGIKNERVFSAEAGYTFRNAWLHASVNGFYSRMTNVTDWQCIYFDDCNAFAYNSVTGLKKSFYGVEAGLKFKLASCLDLKMVGTVSEAKTTNNARVRYMMSGTGVYTDDVLYSEGMHEACTPLTAASVGVSYHSGGWYVGADCNYYDRIYLSYSPYNRYRSVLQSAGAIDADGKVREGSLDQAKGKGGLMVDGSIGRSINMKHGQLLINLSVSNVLNNRRICIGGYEQSRAAYNDNVNVYNFRKSPKKYYAFGANGMLDITYRF